MFGLLIKTAIHLLYFDSAYKQFWEYLRLETTYLIGVKGRVYGDPEVRCSYVPCLMNVNKPDYMRFFDINVQGEDNLKHALLCSFENMVLRVILFFI